MQVKPYSILIVILILSGCGSGDAFPPILDTTPPSWTDTEGVTEIVTDQFGVHVYWGNIFEAESLPVEILIYVDEDDSPWDTTPIVTLNTPPFTLTDLSHEKQYWIGVRCRDSAAPSNGESNTVIRSVTPVPRGWARSWGGSGMDFAWKVALDSSDNVYVAGAIRETVDLGSVTCISNGHWDSILCVFDPDGNLLWARSWGGPSWDWARSVAVDDSGNVFVTGEFSGGVDFNPGPGVDLHVADGPWDAFLTSFTSTGDFQWAVTWGGPSWEEGLDVEVDNSGNIFVCGSLADTVDLDPGPGTDIHEGFVLPDAFLSKFDNSGNYIWGRHWGDNDWDWATGVAVDGSGNPHVTGSFFYTVDFDPGPGIYNVTSNGNWDAFLLKLDSSGNFQHVRTWGDSDWDEALEIVLDSSGNSYITGFNTGVVDFDPGPLDDLHGASGTRNAYLTRYDFSGNYTWSRAWPVGGENYGYGLALDSTGNIFVAGFFEGVTNFDPGPSVSNAESVGASDIFLSKFDPPGDFVWASTWGGYKTDWGLSVVCDSEDFIYVSGSMGGAADLDPGLETDIHYSEGSDDAWLVKVSPYGTW